MAPRIVQTPAGNLDKWRSNDSRPVDLIPSMIARPPLFAGIKKFRDQTIEVARLTCILLQTDFSILNDVLFR